MIPEREVIGIKKSTVKKDNKTITYTNIHCAADFTDASGTIGREVKVLTTTQEVNLLVGDKFKALYDVGQRWNADTRQFENVPVLAEIVKISK